MLRLLEENPLMSPNVSIDSLVESKRTVVTEISHQSDCQNCLWCKKPSTGNPPGHYPEESPVGTGSTGLTFHQDLGQTNLVNQMILLMQNSSVTPKEAYESLRSPVLNGQQETVLDETTKNDKILRKREEKF